MLSLFIIFSLFAALGIGIYVGLGMPGISGREDRVVSPGRARRLPTRHLDWLRPRKR